MSEIFPKILVIEGPIAAGKSVLAEVLGEYATTKGIKTVIIREPVDKWVECGILEKFYKDRKANAYSFQTYAFVTRCNAINQQVLDNPGAELFIIERSPATDQLFMYLMRDLLDDCEKIMYKAWINLFYNILKLDLTKATALYLRTDLADCMERLKMRGRAGEDMAGMQEYQRELINAHDNFLLKKEVAEDFFPTCPYKNVIEISADTAKLNYKTNKNDQKTISELVFASII
jgi:deoxyadenosine/deoxycytidine kinase